MLVRDPKVSLSCSCGSARARVNAGKSDRSATRSRRRPIEIAGLRVCVAAESGVVVRITGICLTEERPRTADKPSLHFYGALSIGRLPPMETHGNPKHRLRDPPPKGVRRCKACHRRLPQLALRFSPSPRLQSKPYRLILVHSLRLACLMRG